MAIVQRKNKGGKIRYQVKVKDRDGKWFPTATYADLVDAKGEEARLMGMKRKGALGTSEDARQVTVNEYWEVWAVENRSGVSAGWKLSQDQMMRDYVAPIIGDEKMAHVDAPKIGRVLNRMKEQGRSDQMRKHVYSLLRKLFGDAVEYYEMLAANPVKPKFHRPKVREQMRPFLKPDQAWQLLGFARSHYLGPAVWLQTLAGMRSEAALALDWSAVLWDLDQILICRAWKQKVGIIADYPKGSQWEYVPMPPALKDYLMAVWESRGRPAAGFVCLNKTGTRMLPYDTYIDSLKLVCRKAGVPEMTTHELRHSCTELYVQKGASGEDIRRLLNQKSLTATKRYIHRTDERLSGFASQLSMPMLRVIEGEKVSFPNSFPIGKKEAVCVPKKGARNV